MFPEVLNLFIPMLVLLRWVKLCRDRSGIYYDPYIPLWKQPDHRLASQKHEALLYRSQHDLDEKFELSIPLSTQSHE